MREREVDPIESILKSYRGNCVCLELVSKHCPQGKQIGTQMKQDWP